MKSKNWTKPELDALREHYPTMPLRKLAELLGVSHTAVVNRAKKLGLVRPKRVALTEEEKRQRRRDRSSRYYRNHMEKCISLTKRAKQARKEQRQAQQEDEREIIRIKFPERNCIKCKNYPCFTGMKNIQETDYASVGCHGYTNKSKTKHETT